MTAVPLDSVAALRAISAEVCEGVFRPPPVMTVSEWADRHRVLPKTAAESGRFRTARLPYLRAVMDALGDETIRYVVFAKSAQVGATTVGENFIGYLIDQAPCGILMLWPTEKKLRSWSRKNLKPLIEDSECLAARFPHSGRRDSGNTIAAKEFPGGFLQMLTAKSTSDLRSTSARVGVVEEADEIDQEVGGQGDPIGQFEARQRTYWNAKTYENSTPVLEGSRIWGDYLRSTQGRYYVPCPHCGHFQTLRWRDGEEEGGEESGAYRLIYEKDENGEVVPGSACYLCESCGALIEEHHRMAMLAAGEWRHAHPGRFMVGFHINTLYSPLVPWDDFARFFEKARRAPTLMQNFDNLWRGLPYREPGASLTAHFLAARAERYGDEAVEVPHGVGLLTAGVDTQGGRLELFVWGWGADEESWFIRWEVIEGDLGTREPWDTLDRWLLKEWRHASGATLRIAAACVDAGYQTERVHRFADARVGRHVIAIVGRAGRPKPIIQPPAATKFRRRSKKRPTHVVGVESAKDLWASRLRLTLRADGTAPPGYVHFPDDLDAAFYEQMTSERLTTDYDKAGHPFRTWKKIEGRANEAWDGAGYAMAALHYLVLRRALELRQLGGRAKALSEWKPPETGAERAPEGKKPRRPGFVRRW